MHDITAARAHALPALYRAAAAGLPALADPGYEGAGIGILIPARQPAGGQELDINTRTRNALQRSLRCPGERGFALLTGRWRTLQHITASPGKIGDIARAAPRPHPFRIRLHQMNFAVGSGAGAVAFLRCQVPQPLFPGFPLRAASLW